MTNDWKDALAALGNTLPEGDENIRETASESNEKKNTPKSVTLFYEKKGRAGKPATILADFAGVDEKDLSVLASELKSRLGTGGSVRGGEILIQGDRRNDLRALLSARGFKVKG